MKSCFSKSRPNAITCSGRFAAGAAFVLALFVSGQANAEVFRVGPGEKYGSLADVARKLSPGDEVELKGGTTYGSVLFDRHGKPGNPIVIRGVSVDGKRPIVHGGRDTIEAAGNHYVFENIEITGGSFRCFFHRAHDITLRRVVIHDCPAHGILGADEGSGSLLLEQSEIYRCGEGDKRHPIYMATDERMHPGSVFRMQFCYVHDGNGGNNIKSRAERNEIYYNWVEGALYHELELIGPDGGDPSLKREDSEVVGNVFRKTNASYSVRIGGDGTGETNGRYRFLHNTFLLERENRAVFRLFDGVESVEMHNNVVYAMGGGPVDVIRTSDVRWSTGREQISGANNWIPQGSRSVPSGWTGTLYGSDPGFENLRELDLRPAIGSPLRDAAAPMTVLASPPSFSFPNPLRDVAFQPPVREKGVKTLVRQSDGKPDIGAYEGGFDYVEAEPTQTMSLSGSSSGSLGPSRPGGGGGRCGCILPGEVQGGKMWFGLVMSIATAMSIGVRMRVGARRVSVGRDYAEAVRD
ncbi:MAG: hypothetical protein FWD57_00955 [Polyangiaceae bacterium]|nr:hypothetical protein [Polyangiaceae bacterium]